MWEKTKISIMSWHEDEQHKNERKKVKENRRFFYSLFGTTDETRNKKYFWCGTAFRNQFQWAFSHDCDEYRHRLVSDRVSRISHRTNNRGQSIKCIETESIWVIFLLSILGVFSLRSFFLAYLKRKFKKHFEDVIAFIVANWNSNA